ncbi:hypothetical protein ABK040_005566 [Willaertia magna]
MLNNNETITNPPSSPTMRNPMNPTTTNPTNMKKLEEEESTTTNPTNNNNNPTNKTTNEEHFVDNLAPQTKKTKLYEDIIPESEKFYNYYFNIQKIVETKEEMSKLIYTLQQPLPLTFRINDALPENLILQIKKQIENFKLELNKFYFNEKEKIIVTESEMLQEKSQQSQEGLQESLQKSQENNFVMLDILNLKDIDPLIYQVVPNISKKKIKNFNEFLKFRDFLIKLNDIGFVTRQELVSMIPPLCFTKKLKSQHNTLQENTLSQIYGYVDMCSAPGSKSTQMCEYLLQCQPNKFLICNDIDKKRLHTLNTNINNRMPYQLLSNIIITHHNAITLHQLLKNIPIYGIICDAVCSGDGTLRKSVDLWQRWNYDLGHVNHVNQISILVSAMNIILNANYSNNNNDTINNDNNNEKISDNGGHLIIKNNNKEEEMREIIYSTCSLNPIENEAVVSEAIRRTGNKFEIIPIEGLSGLKYKEGLVTWKVTDKFGNLLNSPNENNKTMFPKEEENKLLNLERTMRILPHLNNSGGFYVAKLRLKTENLVDSLQKKVKNKVYNSKDKNRDKNLIYFKKVNEEILKEIYNFYGLNNLDYNHFILQIQKDTNLSKLPKKIFYISNLYLVNYLLKNYNEESILPIKIYNAGIVCFELDNQTKRYFLTCQGATHLLPYLLQSTNVALPSANVASTLEEGLSAVSAMSASGNSDEGKNNNGVSTQLVKIKKEEMVSLLKNGKLLLEDNEKVQKEMKMGPCVLQCVELPNLVAIGNKINYNLIQLKTSKDDVEKLLTKLEYDYNF